MAWFAELKRRRWYCINQFDAIRWYSKYLYNEWYNSLTEEQKQRLEENRRRKREKTEREAQEAIRRLAIMAGIITGVSNKSKYHGVYNEDGTPNTEFLAGLDRRT